MPVPPDYRIIYNWDGAPHGYSPAPQSMEEFLEKVYAPLEETQVGALSAVSRTAPQRSSLFTSRGCHLAWETLVR